MSVKIWASHVGEVIPVVIPSESVVLEAARSESTVPPPCEEHLQALLDLEQILRRCPGETFRPETLIAIAQWKLSR